MPNRSRHKRVSEEFLGTYTPALHNFLDAPSQGELKGNHDVLFHDYETVKFIEKKLGREVAREALLHIILDLEKWRKTEKRVLKI